VAQIVGRIYSGVLFPRQCPEHIAPIAKVDRLLFGAEWISGPDGIIRAFFKERKAIWVGLRGYGQ